MSKAEKIQRAVAEKLNISYEELMRVKAAMLKAGM